FVQRLQRIVVVAGESAIDHVPRRACRVADAEVRRLEDRARHALGRDRVLADEVPVSSQHAAEILRPWAVDRAVDHHAADLTGAQFLRLRWKTEKRIDLAVGEKLLRRDRRAGDPADVLSGIEPDMGGYGRNEHIWGVA